MLVIAKRDRLARDVLIAGWVEKEVLRRGARIVSAAGEASDDMNDPYAKAMRQIIAVFAELERDLIRARTKAAIAVKKSEGERWCNTAPFGYRWNVGNEPVPNAKEQRIVTLVNKLRKDGVSFRGIVAELKKQRRTNRVLFQNSIERSCRFSVVMAEDPAESLASRDRA